MSDLGKYNWKAFFHFAVCPEGWNDYKGKQCIFMSTNAFDTSLHFARVTQTPCRRIRHSRLISVEEPAKDEFLDNLIGIYSIIKLFTFKKRI